MRCDALKVVVFLGWSVSSYIRELHLCMYLLQYRYCSLSLSVSEFQVVALVHTLLNHKETNVHTILIVCPLSTVLNWVNEFNIWLKDIANGEEVNVFELSK